MHLGGALHLFWLQGNSLGSRIEAVIAQYVLPQNRNRGIIMSTTNFDNRGKSCA